MTKAHVSESRLSEYETSFALFGSACYLSLMHVDAMINLFLFSLLVFFCASHWQWMQFRMSNRMNTITMTIMATSCSCTVWACDMWMWVRVYAACGHTEAMFRSTFINYGAFLHYKPWNKYHIASFFVLCLLLLSLFCYAIFHSLLKSQFSFLSLWHQSALATYWTSNKSQFNKTW